MSKYYIFFNSTPKLHAIISGPSFQEYGLSVKKIIKKIPVRRAFSIYLVYRHANDHSSDPG